MLKAVTAQLRWINLNIKIFTTVIRNLPLVYERGRDRSRCIVGVPVFDTHQFMNDLLIGFIRIFPPSLGLNLVVINELW